MARRRGSASSIDTRSRAAAAPGPILVTERDRRGTTTCTEKVFGECLDDCRVIPLAAENVEVGIVRIIRKMAADQGGRNELHHGIAGDATRAEIDDLAFAKTLHVDELTQLNDIATDMVGITDEVGVAILEVDGGTKSPRLPFTNHILGGKGSGYWGLGWKDRGL